MQRSPPLLRRRTAAPRAAVRSPACAPSHVRCRYGPDARARAANMAGKSTHRPKSRLWQAIDPARPAVESGAVRGVAGVLCALFLIYLSACGGRPSPAGTKETDPQRGGELTVLVSHADAAPDPHAVRG